MERAVRESTPPAVTEYRLELDVRFAEARWEGTIEIDIGSGASSITLDAADLVIDSGSTNGNSLTVVSRPEAQEVELQGLTDSSSTVTVKFHGMVSERGLMGLYRSRSGSGYVLSTQCAATGARRIFPCFDRPDRKAIFRLSVTTEPDEEVIFNTSPEKVDIVGGRRRWTFAPTPSMAPYLFYLGIGRFERRNGPPEGIPITLFASPGRSDAGSFALEHAGPILRAFEEYYRIPYPLTKLDLIALNEHPFGAMENWGAISFREALLLVDGTTSALDRRMVVETLAHEIAHQWFGNLVTMEWWTDIWLNESFATFLEQRTVDRLYPGFDSLSDLLLGWVGPALDGDSLVATHPVSSPVTRPEEISQIFDEISYGKGAAVLRMIERYLGQAPFRAGVETYLRRFRYSNARTEDLWEALASSSGERVTEILGPWIERPGFPLLTTQPAKDGLLIGQKRFLLNGKHQAGTWPIPIVAELNGIALRILLDAPSVSVPTDHVASLHMNPGAVGFYRVLYDPAHYELLLQDFSRRPVADRWTILNDLFAFLLSGDVAFEQLERFLLACKDSDDFLLINDASRRLSDLWLWIGRNESFLRLGRSFLSPQMDRRGQGERPGERDVEGVMREGVAETLVKFDPRFVEVLAARFADRERLDPNMRGPAALALAMSGGATEHAILRKALSSASSESEENRLEKGLAWFRQPELVAETLDLIFLREINRGHVPAILENAARNPAGRDVTWTWMSRNLSRLDREFRGTGFLTGLFESTIPYLGLGRSDTVQEFFRRHSYPEGTRGIRNGLELLEIAEGFIRRVG